MPATLHHHLVDLFAHMAWADAVWFGAWGKSAQREDADLRARVRHVTDTEAAFLMVLRGQPVSFPVDAPLPAFADLQAATRQHHAAYRELLALGGPEALARRVTIPWFPGPPCEVTVGEALTQVALHTQHHRGQLMTRLKDLGGQPQNVDYIIWAWKQRPEGRWADPG